MENNKTAAIIQARMGSTRLPGKVMKKLKGKPVLWHVIQRVKQSKLVDEIIIATTSHKRDKIIYDKALEWGVKAYGGSEENVLSRYYEAAHKYKIDTVVRITSDDPLIDPFIIDTLIKIYKEQKYCLVTNSSEEKRTFPIGLDVEVLSYEILEKAYNNAEEKYEKEHVTPYIYENLKNNVYVHHNNKDYSYLRLTLDTPEDYKFMKKLFNHFFDGKHNFYLKDIVNFLNKNPEIILINKNVKQKSYKDEV